MIALATFAQWKFESSYSDVKSTETPKSTNGRNLRAQLYETNKKDVEIIDHEKVLDNAIKSWRLSVETES